MKTASLTLVALMVFVTPLAVADDLNLSLRYQTPTSAGSRNYHRLQRQEKWAPAETALIVCDVWDYHHSINAVRRVEEFGPRLNELVKAARARGVTIIHAPSDCMMAYADHPARKRALETPLAEQLPPDIKSWCARVPSEEQAVYPLDQSDGGEDDDPAEHAAWAKKLAAMGRKPGTPWLKQSDLIEIDAERDFISDRGDEVWSILAARGVQNVILTGVHTNMCVLGRPFGLRQLARNGKRVTLARDMTDTMYNPARWPYVNHFTGNDLIIDHIERHICPTITSDQFLEGAAFRFKLDTRPHVAIVVAEDEYETNQTLPKFASEQLGKAFRVSLVFEDAKNPNHLPGLEVLNEAELLLVSVRRRPLTPGQLEIVKNFVAAGKPVVGIRTASHAFSLRTNETPPGLAAWATFDAEVFGGNYTGHHANSARPTITPVAEAGEHSLLARLADARFTSGGSLYQVAPLAKKTTPLLVGEIEGQPAEPVAWTFERADGGRSFYTSLGHKRDFDQPEFIRLLVNALHWAAGLSGPELDPVALKERQDDWRLSAAPGDARQRILRKPSVHARKLSCWYRCAVRIRDLATDPADIVLLAPTSETAIAAWANGRELSQVKQSASGIEFAIDRERLHNDDANLLVLRLPAESNWSSVPKILVGDKAIDLQGRWQYREGDDPTWSNIPLPAKFGLGPDVYFE